jgi:hypothetical protein
MWMRAGQLRYKTYYNKKRELKVVEDHSVDAKWPIELEFDRPPMTMQEGQRFNEVLSILQYLEWFRIWNSTHLVVPGELRRHQQKQILQSVEGQSRSIEEIEESERAMEYMRKHMQEGEKTHGQQIRADAFGQSNN